MWQLRYRIANLPQQLWLLIFVIGYGFYIAVSIFGSMSITRWVDENYPFRFFYHLELGEEAGPMGDPNQLLFVVGVDYTLFILIFIPIALIIAVPNWMIITLAIFNEPVFFTGLTFWILISRR